MIAAISVLFAQLIWAIGAIYLKKATLTVNPFLAIVIIEVCVMLVLIPVFLLSYRELLAVNRQEFLWMAIRGITVAIGNVLFIYGLSKLSLSQTSLLTMTYPLFAVLLAIVFLGEALTVKFVIAAILFSIGFLLLV